MSRMISCTKLLTTLVILFLSIQLTAQCSFSCVTTPANASADSNCEVTITWQMIVTPATVCAPPYEIIVRTIPGDTLITGIDVVDLPVENLLGEIVSVTLIHQGSGQSCERIYNIVDETEPNLVCPSDTISCTASTAPNDVAAISAPDNCNGSVTVGFSDMIQPADCDSVPFIAKVLRTWTAVDESDNVAVCTQTINIEKPSTVDVEFPGDGPFPCDSPSHDPSFTGEPTIDGNPIDSNGFCLMAPIFEDDTVNISINNGVRILRYWTVTDWCSGSILRDTQFINVIDMQAPVITCPDPMTVGTDFDVCFATVNLTGPATVSDNCGVLDTIYLINNQPVAQPFVLTPGTQTIEIVVRDESFNADTCSMELTVLDTQTPTAVCDQITSVSLTTTGQAIVPAFNFDDGSYDNCSPLHFLASRDGGPFDPNVVFDCDDVGNIIMVTVRVVEVLNGFSFTDCMVDVEVEDKLSPIFISCPSDLTIDCDDDYSNLDDYGVPVPFDNCGTTLTESDQFNIGMCGTGDIVRTFTATDPIGNSVSCSQTINVENSTPFDGSTIVWPLDYEVFNECLPASDLDPEDLPTGYDKPEATGTGCAMIAESYDNQIFDIDFPACYKIVRNWTLIDWCTYDPSNQGAGGYWTHQQLIKVTDTEAPVIDCSPPMTVGIDSVCGFALVNIPPLAMNIGCNSMDELIIIHDSPYATNPGADASGYYPMGTHTITFEVIDGCGNESSCSVTITVIDDKMPSPFCSNGIITELQEMSGNIMAMVTAEAFDEGSFDNCTADEDLIFTIKFHDPSVMSIATEDKLIFDCSHLGSHQIEIWVEDEAGNADFCVTSVIVQDNMALCPVDDDPLMASISGDILNEMGYEVEDVMVEVEGSNVFPDTTGFGGSFAFPNLPIGFNYKVMPEKDMHPLNGVTTFDMVLISKHVLNVKKLDTPYKIIAADINKSGTVSTLDIVELRKMILMINEDFPQNKSWRFVEKSHQFINDDNPFNPPFPETLEVQNFTQDELEANFTGVKIGDVNNTALPNSLMNSDDRSYFEDLVLVAENQEIRRGGVFEVEFKLEEMMTLLGYQFTIEFDDRLAEFIEVKEGILKEENFGLSYVDEGSITTSWFDLDKKTFSNEEVLFTLEFKAKSDISLSEIFEINSKYTLAEAYDENDELLNVKLEFENYNSMHTNLKPTFELYQNQPNPFKKTTLIRFRLPEATSGRLTIYDLSGKVLKTFDQDFGEGYNEFNIQKGELNSTGVLYYQLETPDYTATKKMILLN